jgi:hypothetical protein
LVNNLQQETCHESMLGSIGLSLLLATTARSPSRLGEYDSAILDTERHDRRVGLLHPHGFVRLKTADRPGPSSRTALAHGKSRPYRDMLSGQRATVVGYQNRNKPEELRAERITVGDKTLELR